MNVSVIIPCHNAAATLGVQLEALARQEFAGAWEVIVADNGSTDRTVAVAASFAERLPRLRVVGAGARPGASHARNCGARAARYDLLAFCDADDEVAPGYLHALAEALAQHPFVACRYDFRKLNRHWITRCHTETQVAEVDSGLYGPYCYGGGGGLGVRKAVHEAVGGFDEDLLSLEDTDYCIRLQRAGYSLRFVPDALVHVRWRTSVIAAFLQARRWGSGYVAVRLRHWPPDGPPDNAASLVRHLLRIRRVRSAEQLARWIWSAGWQLGSIEGWRRHWPPARPLPPNLHSRAAAVPLASADTNSKPTSTDETTDLLRRRPSSLPTHPTPQPDAGSDLEAATRKRPPDGNPGVSAQNH